MNTSFSPKQHEGARYERRLFLRRAAAAAGAVVLGPAAFDVCRGRTWAANAEPSVPGLIARQRNPDNLEFPFASLDRFVTPNERFYVRNHFAPPELDVRTWRLRVEGRVRQPLQISYEDLRRLPSRTVTATLECAGNGRSFLTPATRGVQWQLGAVSNAEWTGVPLAAVLEQAGLRDAAVDVVLEGADRGPAPNEPTLGTIAFARSLPVAKARQQDVLLAYRMNGVDLPPAHGFPLRAVVPGWYGMASVKWLTRIFVTDRPFDGFWQTLDYSIFERRHSLPGLTPLGEMQVKAQIARPRPQEIVPARADYRIHGAAWTGEAEITRVEVSTDGSRTWAPARLLGQPMRHAWRLWEYPWRTPPQAGRVQLAARATDARGRTQPATRDPDRRNYMINHVLPVEVDVR
jgi:DMSO/TMAO reductase YedYZ molybdopterin-dependent catalytic subunit